MSTCEEIQLDEAFFSVEMAFCVENLVHNDVSLSPRVPNKMPVEMRCVRQQLTLIFLVPHISAAALPLYIEFNAV